MRHLIYYLFLLLVLAKCQQKEEKSYTGLEQILKMSKQSINDDYELLKKNYVANSIHQDRKTKLLMLLDEYLGLFDSLQLAPDFQGFRHFESKKLSNIIKNLEQLNSTASKDTTLALFYTFFNNTKDRIEHIKSIHKSYKAYNNYESYLRLVEGIVHFKKELIYKVEYSIININCCFVGIQFDNFSLNDTLYKDNLQKINFTLTIPELINDGLDLSPTLLDSSKKEVTHDTKYFKNGVVLQFKPGNAGTYRFIINLNIKSPIFPNKDTTLKRVNKLKVYE